jgi:hypothetical protein
MAGLAGIWQGSSPIPATFKSLCPFYLVFFWQGWQG